MAFDAYLYFPGSKTVKGETLDSEMSKKHAFQLTQFEFGVENTSSIGSESGGMGAGKCSFKEFSITKRTDSASCGLFSGCAVGFHFKDAVMELRRAGGSVKKSGATFFKIEFKQVIVKDMSWSGTDGDDVLEEKLVLEFGAMKISYWEQSADGKMKKPSTGGEAEWSQKLNEAKFAVSL